MQKEWPHSTVVLSSTGLRHIAHGGLTSLIWGFSSIGMSSRLAALRFWRSGAAWVTGETAEGDATCCCPIRSRSAFAVPDALRSNNSEPSILLLPLKGPSQAASLRGVTEAARRSKWIGTQALAAQQQKHAAGPRPKKESGGMGALQ